MAVEDQDEENYKLLCKSSLEFLCDLGYGTRLEHGGFHLHTEILLADLARQANLPTNSMVERLERISRAGSEPVKD